MPCRSRERQETRNGSTVAQSIYTACSFAEHVSAAATITRSTSRIGVDGWGRKSFAAALFTFVLFCKFPRLALETCASHGVLLIILFIPETLQHVGPVEFARLPLSIFLGLVS